MSHCVQLSVQHLTVYNISLFIQVWDRNQMKLLAWGYKFCPGTH